MNGPAAHIVEDLARRVNATRPQARRRLIAIAGQPASGKSSMAEQLAAALSADRADAQVVPMDGFHLDNRLLDIRGLRSRKGAPETFDAGGFVTLIRRLATEDEVIFPVFDRSRDIAIAGAGVVGPTCDTVIVEGNYLLFDAPVWRDLRPLWDIAVALDVPGDVLRARLIRRWLDHGLSRAEAEHRTDANDMPNAARVADAMLPCDIAY